MEESSSQGCNPDAGGCGSLHADGEPCDQDIACQSSHCANGYCCTAGDCCQAPEQCPGSTYSNEPTCTDPSTCQGQRVEATCVDHMCGSVTVEDDRACTRSTLAAVCPPFPDVTCTGASEQRPPMCGIPDGLIYIGAYNFLLGVQVVDGTSRVVGAYDAASNHVRIEASGFADGAFTFTYQVPGACQDGSVSVECGDLYRLCTTTEAFPRLTVVQLDASNEPRLNGPECAWTLTDLGSPWFSLRNFWVMANTDRGDLECSDAGDGCHFTAVNEEPWANRFMLTPVPCGTRSICSQTCMEVDWTATCGCFPGYTMGSDGSTCDPWPAMVVFHYDTNLVFNLADDHAITLQASGRPVKFTPVGGRHDAVTFDLEVPVTCPPGSDAMDCVDIHRLCAGTSEDSPTQTLLKRAGYSAPPGWYHENCQWVVREEGGGAFMLWNVQRRLENSSANMLLCNADGVCYANLPQEVDVTGYSGVFVKDVDECWDGTHTCSVNATCTNRLFGYDCVCKPGFLGEGFDCVANQCLANNGGCAQKCSPLEDGSPACGCLTGFQIDADGTSCNPVSPVALYNVGLGMYLDVGSSQSLLFNAIGHPVSLSTAVGRHDAITVDISMVDTFRLCMNPEDGQWRTLQRSGTSAPPVGWDEPPCQWVVEDLGDNQLRLRSPLSAEPLLCPDANTCAAGGDPSDNHSIFLVDLDECSLGTVQCQAHASCRNHPGFTTCECDPGFAGKGEVCVPEPCATNNGGCAHECGEFAGGLCRCLPGFTLGSDGKSCIAPTVMHVFHELEMGWLMQNQGGLVLGDEQGSVRMDPVAGTHDTFTFTVEVRPGTCADGVPSMDCVDEYRLCGTLSEWERPWRTVSRNGMTGTPEDWDAPTCQWTVTRTPNDRVSLANVEAMALDGYGILVCIADACSLGGAAMAGSG